MLAITYLLGYITSCENIQTTMPAGRRARQIKLPGGLGWERNAYVVTERPCEDIKIGDSASFTKTISESDIYAFAGITGDFNPLHVNEEFANQSRFKKRIAHGMLSASLISTVLGTALPGINTIYLAQEVKFLAPVFIGDTLTARVEVVAKNDAKRILDMKTTVTNQEGKTVVDGRARVMKD